LQRLHHLETTTKLQSSVGQRPSRAIARDKTDSLKTPKAAVEPNQR
jgi:hypothetical protein